MNRIATWKSLGITVGFLLTVSAICFAIGDTSKGSTLIVVAIVEGTAHALLIAIVSGWRRHRESRAA